MIKRLLIIVLIIAGVALVGLGAYAVSKAENEKNNVSEERPAESENEREDIYEDGAFIVYDPNGEALPRISALQLDAGKAYTFKVSKDFTYDVVPNDTIGASLITYKVNDVGKVFTQRESLASGFNITQGEDNSLTLDLSSGANLKNVLEKIHSAPVDISTSDVLKKDKIFTIVIRAKGSNDVRYIDFGLNTCIVSVSPTEIVIG